MKLINITTRYYIIVFLVVLVLWSFAFYFIMKHEVYNNINEVLHNRAHNVILYIQNNQNDIIDHPLSDFTITEVSESNYKMLKDEMYSDTLVYEATDDEYDDYRKLKTKFSAKNKYYALAVIKPRLESTEIINTILYTLLPLSALMILLLAISATLLNKKLWQPFYNIIEFLSDYRIDQEKNITKQNIGIDEFNRLEESIQSLTIRNQQVFREQKQFIENASHETQTPLAVIQSQLEILLQAPDLSGSQAELIQSALKETDRLSKLNKTLLLISKIENQQFLEKSPVFFLTLAKNLLVYFEEKKEKLNLSVEFPDGHDSVIQTNPILAEVLVGNLIKNAFTHNIPGGKVIIRITGSMFEIQNTGDPMPEVHRVFERFYNRGSGEGWGLGLSIVKKIVAINNWTIEYDWSGQNHIFRVKFS
jgi:signal transduction histidine kinase